MINYPIDCHTEASKLSFLYKLLTVYIVWFNARGLGMDAEATLKRDIIHQAIAFNRAIAEDTNYHGMTGLVNGKVVFPDSVKHEGARLSAMFALDKVLGGTLYDNDDFQIKLSQAIIDAENGTKWQPTMEDINVT